MCVGMSQWMWKPEDKVSFFLAPCGLWESNLACQSWQQMPLPAKLSHQPRERRETLNPDSSA